MKAAVCREPGKPLVFEDRPLPEIEEDEILIKVQHCGICHSDLHIVDAEWPGLPYPLVPGHEVVGVVEKAGKRVIHFSEGDRVGMPWIYSACGHCEFCLEGDDPLCPHTEVTGITKQGGYAEYMKAPADYAVGVPDKLRSINAAPLFCAGLTVYAALVHAGIKPGDRVAVQGIGGLGHLAVQYAHAMGASVAAVGRTKDKADLARQLGADLHIASEEEDVVEALKAFGPPDILLTTIFNAAAIEALLPALNKRGRLSIVGAATEAIKVNPGDLIGKRISVTGSAVGSRKILKDMLWFSAERNILPMVEEVPFDQVNEGLDRLRRGEPRFRQVLSMA
jgi:alcohol dehydrogenase, propanol-preferring